MVVAADEREPADDGLVAVTRDENENGDSHAVSADVEERDFGDVGGRTRTAEGGEGLRRRLRRQPGASNRGCGAGAFAEGGLFAGFEANTAGGASRLGRP